MADVDDELSRLWRVKQIRRRPSKHLGDAAQAMFAGEVTRRYEKLSPAVRAWHRCVPPVLGGRTHVVGLRAGVLTVLVDSSPHLASLRQLLLAGLEEQLCAALGPSLKKVSLKYGTMPAPTAAEEAPAPPRRPRGR